MVVSRRLLGVLGLTVLFAGAVVACDQRSTDDRGGMLRAAALELVPPGSTVVATEEGACIQVAAFPSCVTTHFCAPATNFSEHVAAVRAEARKLGWEEQLVRDGSTPRRVARDRP